MRILERFVLADTRHLICCGATKREDASLLLLCGFRGGQEHREVLGRIRTYGKHLSA